jgi:hypothetical protein
MYKLMAQEKIGSGIKPDNKKNSINPIAKFPLAEQPVDLASLANRRFSIAAAVDNITYLGGLFHSRERVTRRITSSTPAAQRVSIAEKVVAARDSVSESITAAKANLQQIDQAIAAAADQYPATVDAARNQADIDRRRAKLQQKIDPEDILFDLISPTDSDLEATYSQETTLRRLTELPNVVPGLAERLAQINSEKEQADRARTSSPQVHEPQTAQHEPPATSARPHRRHRTSGVTGVSDDRMFARREATKPEDLALDKISHATEDEGVASPATGTESFFGANTELREAFLAQFSPKERDILETVEHVADVQQILENLWSGIDTPKAVTRLRPPLSVLRSKLAKFGADFTIEGTVYGDGTGSLSLVKKAESDENSSQAQSRDVNTPAPDGDTNSQTRPGGSAVAATHMPIIVTEGDDHITGEITHAIEPLVTPGEASNEFILKGGESVIFENRDIAGVLPLVGQSLETRTRDLEISESLGTTHKDVQQMVGEANRELLQHGIEIGFKFGNGDNGYYYRETGGQYSQDSDAPAKLTRILDVSAVESRHRAAVEEDQAVLLKPGENPGEFILRNGSTIHVSEKTALLLRTLREGYGNDLSSDQLAKRIGSELGKGLVIEDIHNMVGNARSELSELEEDEFIAIRYDDDGRGYYLDHKTTVHKRKPTILGQQHTSSPRRSMQRPAHSGDVKAAVTAALDVTPAEPPSETLSNVGSADQDSESQTTEPTEFATLTRTDVASLAAIVHDNYIQRHLKVHLESLNISLPNERELIDLISPRAEKLLAANRQELIDIYYMPAIVKVRELVERDDFYSVVAEVFDIGAEGEMVWSVLTDVAKLHEINFLGDSQRIDGITYLERLMTDPESVNQFIMATIPADKNPDEMRQGGNDVIVGDLTAGKQLDLTTVKNEDTQHPASINSKKMHPIEKRLKDNGKPFGAVVRDLFDEIYNGPEGVELPLPASPGVVTRAYNSVTESRIEDLIEAGILKVQPGKKADHYVLDAPAIVTALVMSQSKIRERLDKRQQKQVQALIETYYGAYLAEKESTQQKPDKQR